MKSLQQLDLNGLHVLDGGLATELERKGFDLSGPMWSAHVLETSPEAIAAVHRDYLEAGADCLITASYQVSEEGFQQLGLAPAEAAQAAAKALRASVSLAEDVKNEYQTGTPRKIWIAASLGSYGAMLHNGAEFHGNYTCSFAELVAFHSRRIAVMAETNADFLAFETVPSLEEARAIVAALQPYPNVPAYISFSCRDGVRVSHGETLRACAELLEAAPQVIGVGVNCTNPDFIASLIAELAHSTSKHILVYPNSGEQWDAEHRCFAGNAPVHHFGSLARAWRTAGAQWIGGCCRTGPDQIRAVSEVWRGPAGRNALS
jgi:homocysteine S-methyltransferase